MYALTGKYYYSFTVEFVNFFNIYLIEQQCKTFYSDTQKMISVRKNLLHSQYMLVKLKKIITI